MTLTRTLTVTAAAISLMAGPALAASMCSHAPALKFQPKSVLIKKLKAEGVSVRRIKTESGCYEVYGIKNGHKVNVAFNAETLKMASNPEAGEN